MAFVMEKLAEDKRKLDVAAMKQARFPRIGDACVVFAGMCSGLPPRAVSCSGRIHDMDLELGRLRFVSTTGLTVEHAIDDYRLNWWYADDPEASR